MAKWVSQLCILTVLDDLVVGLSLCICRSKSQWLYKTHEQECKNKQYTWP